MDTYMDNYNTNIKDLEGYQTELAELIKTEMNNNSQIMFDMVLKDNNAIMNSSVQKAASNNIASKWLINVDRDALQINIIVVWRRKKTAIYEKGYSYGFNQVLGL